MCRAFQGYFADFSIEVAREHLPADMNRAGHDIGLARVLAVCPAPGAPVSKPRAVQLAHRASCISAEPTPMIA